MSFSRKKFSPIKGAFLRERPLEFFCHQALEEWGGKDQRDTFALLHPLKRRKKHGLYVVLHSAGHDLYSSLSCTLYKGNHDIYHVPEDLYGLFLDCRSHEERDFWWGGRRKEEEEDISRQKTIQAVEKRVCATVEWAVKEYGIDPERVYLCGNSMGGSGALGIGMAHGELFAAIKANVPAGVSHMLDRTVRTGKKFPDPPICIDYSAQNDPWSCGHGEFYKAMRENSFALFGYWADFGHANNNAVILEKNDLVHSFDFLSIRKNEAYPVFTNASSDTPNPWENDPEKVPSSGQVNGFFRWKKGKDLEKIFTMKLFLVTPETLTTSFPIPEEVSTDVSLRRLQKFHIEAGEKIAYSFGDLSGTVRADANGLLTLKGLKITSKETPLILTRCKG